MRLPTEPAAQHVGAGRGEAVTSLSKLAALLGIHELANSAPDAATIADFREQCRTADLPLLGHLLHTARHRVLEEIAVAEVQDRLSKSREVKP